MSTLDDFFYKPNLLPGEGEVTVYSSLYLAIADARVASGRDRDTGDVVNPDPPTKWLGAIGYMALLDMLGSAIRRRVGAPATGNSFKKALESFTALPEAERKAVYALRNAFAHDYSLVNDGPAGTHLFRIEWDVASPLLVLPTVPWDGNYPVVAGTDDTVVNLFRFTELAESVLSAVETAYVAGDLEMAVSDQEAEHRYFITIT